MFWNVLTSTFFPDAARLPGPEDYLSPMAVGPEGGFSKVSLHIQ